MTRLLLLTMLLLPVSATAGNLEPSDYAGTWVSNWVSVRGEEQRLVISPTLSSYFERNLPDTAVQKFEAESAETYEDILVIKYKSNDGGLRYKLVLSGWKAKNAKQLYGTMYMYQNGEQFNGLPVSLVSR